MNTTQEKLKIVFAIYPNAQGFSFVYMNGPRILLDYGIVRIKPICNFRILDKVKKSLDYFKPSVVILLDPDAKSSRTGYRIRNLISQITDLSKQENLQVDNISRDQIREVFENFGVSTKFEISQWLLTEFKELETRRPRERKLWTSEDRNMAIFDALSLALTWFYRNA
ncbi:MAG: hypothetical protein KBF37_06125 [Saprospiraceae bacterium]|jgi:hypothetical protein|nr:hypothetical protein [Saprospiraceae bacterium]MBP9209886.1 hypothetical protein [Saprospiraceae bacterium]MBV6472713.1 hypothetical protein [Saprospiraceae bacterium]